jgi:excisionase family DNA binding protein
MEPLLSIAQAAGFLGVSRWQIYRLIERGELPAVRVGGRLRFVPEELREYLERNRIREPAP